MLKKIFLALIIILNIVSLNGSITRAQIWPFNDDIAKYTINNKNNQFTLKIDLKKDYLIYSNIANNFTDAIKITPETNSNLKNFKFHLPLSSLNNLQKPFYKNQLLIPLEIQLHKAVPTNLTFHIQLTLCKEYCSLHTGKVKFEINNNVNATHDYLLILKVLTFAFLGGIFLNFMPCVLPLISLKIYQISTLSNQGNKSINLSLLGTITGIEITMLLLAVITFFLKSTGEIAGLGFHFQEQNFIITLIIFSLILTLTSTSNYHYNLSALINKFLTFEKLKIEQDFLTGVINGIFIALISTPCTAPFLGIATGYALSCSTLLLFLIYASIGLGLASIYILILLNKKLITYIPKSKKSNDYLSQISKISLYGIMIWLIFILNSLTTTRVAAIVFGCCVLFKFIVLNKKLTKFWLIKYSLLLLLLTTMYIAPQKITAENNANKHIVTNFWQPYNQEHIDTLIAQDNIVLIDVTADWCITCKINHLTTLDNIYVINRLQQAQVKAFRADITKYTSPAIHRLMHNFNRQGIPLNILYSKQYPNGILLDILLYPTEIYKFIK